MSGTNVRITPKLHIDWDGASYLSGEYPVFYIAYYSLRFIDDKGAQTVVLPVGKWFSAPAQGTNSASFDCAAGTLVFASTHFPDGPIPVSISAEVVMVDFMNVSFGLSGFRSFSPVIYNRGLTLSTNLVAESTQTNTPAHIYDVAYDGPYVDPNDRGYPNYPPTSWRTVAVAKQTLTSMHHTLVNLSDRLTKATLLSDLKAATVFLADTHGSGGTFAAYAGPNSFGLTDSVTFFNNDGTPNDVSTAVVRPADAPKMNLVMMHACETVPDMLNLPNGSLTNAYRAFFGPNKIDDTAYAGFGLTVYSQLSNFSGPGDEQCLDLHDACVYTLLRQGYTIAEAVDNANRVYPPLAIVGGVPKRQNMVYSGDGNARLMSVYTGIATPGWDPFQHTLPAAPTAWYKVLNP